MHCIVVIGGRMLGKVHISGIVREMQKQIETKEMRLEKALKKLSETFTDLVLVGGDMREIENPPLWKQHNFADRVNFRNNNSNFCRNHFRRPRANLWSGQRKRQQSDHQC